MNRLTTEKRVQILGMMVEGMSIRAITRLTGVSKNTVAKFLVDAGQACADYQDRTLRNLSCKRIQVDEIWAFCYAKAKNVPTAKAAPEGAGDLWTWTAIDADTKLAVCWLVGDREYPNVPPPRDLYATSDIRMVMVELGKLGAKVDRLIDDVGKQGARIGTLETSVDRVRTGAIVSVTILSLVALVFWWAPGDRITNAVRNGLLGAPPVESPHAPLITQPTPGKH